MTSFRKRELLGLARAALAFALLGAPPSPLGGTPPTTQGTAALGHAEVPSPDTKPLSQSEISSRLEAAASELAALEETLASTDQSHATQARREQTYLRSIDELLRQQAEIAATLAIGQAPPAKRQASKPRSVFALNDLYETRFELSAQLASRKESLHTRRGVLAEARQDFEKAEKARRKGRRLLEEAEDAVARAAAQRELRLLQLASREAQERVHLRALQLQATERERLPGGEDAAGLDERIAEVKAALKRGEGDFDSGLAALAARQQELRSQRRTLDRDRVTIDLQLAAAQQRFSAQTEPTAAAIEEIKTLTVRGEAIRRRIEILDDELERSAALNATWQSWHAALQGGAARQQLSSWLDEAKARIAEYEEEVERHRARLSDLQQRIGAIEARLVALDKGSPERTPLEERRDALVEVQEAERLDGLMMASQQRVLQRFATELREQTGSVDLIGAARGLASTAADVWSYELSVVDDSAITVGSAVSALLLALCGLFAARRGSGLVGHLAENRLGVEPGAANALQALSFYALLLTFTLLALRAVHFPLTVFTVMGGALAIGIGFGSQNVMNNFISGLILMLERPVRARDVIEVDGNHGTIENIGARSTQIRSTDGRHIIVPNSFFLESNVVNWTLSDDMVRAKVSVGVIYGSPTRLVEKLINQVIEENKRILASPRSSIVFEAFGDNSLNFDVYFWVRARSPMQMRKVQSEVRFRIDELFREHGLVIAFPQRDVHLDSASPIEVRVVAEKPNDTTDTKDEEST